MELSEAQQLSAVSGLLKRILLTHHDGKLVLPKEDVRKYSNATLTIDSDGNGGLQLVATAGTKKKKK